MNIPGPAVSVRKGRSMQRELKGSKEGFAPYMSLPETKGFDNSHQCTRSKYRRQLSKTFSSMTIAAISASGSEPRYYKEECRRMEGGM